MIKLARDITNEELKDLISKINTQEENIDTIKEKMDKQLRLHVGKEPPKDSKDGDVWFETK